MKKILYASLIAVMYLVLSPTVDAATIESKEQGGSWYLPGTWVGNVVPQATDDVVINGPVTLDKTNEVHCLWIKENGSLRPRISGTTILVVNQDVHNDGIMDGSANLRLGGSLLGVGENNFNSYTVFGDQIQRKIASLPNSYFSLETSIVLDQDSFRIDSMRNPGDEEILISFIDDGKLYARKISGWLTIDATVYLDGIIGRYENSLDGLFTAPKLILRGQQRFEWNSNYYIDDLIIDHDATLTHFFPPSGARITVVNIFGNIWNHGTIDYRLAVRIYGSFYNYGTIKDTASIALMWPHQDNLMHNLNLWDTWNEDSLLSLSLDNGLFLKDETKPTSLFDIRDILRKGKSIQWKVSLQDNTWSPTFTIDGLVSHNRKRETDYFTVESIENIQQNSDGLTLQVQAKDDSFSGEVYISSLYGTVSPRSVYRSGKNFTIPITIDSKFSTNQIIISSKFGNGRSNIYYIATDDEVKYGALKIVADMLTIGTKIIVTNLDSGIARELLVDESTSSAANILMQQVHCGDSRIETLVDGEVTYTSELAISCNDLTLFELVSAPDHTCNTNGKTPVLLVPGILGSTSRGSKSIFPSLPGEAPLWNSGILKLHDVTVRSPIDGVTPLYSAVGWEQIKIKLSDLGYEEGCTIFDTPYYWVLDATRTSRDYLKPVIDYAKKISGSDHVDIIAHSMGGIVARTYIQSSSYKNDVRKLAFLGTPNYGSLLAYYIWEHGDPISSDNISLGYLGNLLRPNGYFYSNSILQFAKAKIGSDDLCTSVSLSFLGDRLYTPVLACNHDKVKTFVHQFAPSLRDLLPTYEGSLIDQVGQDISDTENTTLLTLNQGIHELAARVEAKVFLGNQKKTLISLMVNIAKEVLDKEIKKEGDGTVAKTSAVIPGISYVEKNESHGALPGSYSTELVEFLKNP